jgi:hypothetical protein
MEDGKETDPREGGKKIGLWSSDSVGLLVSHYIYSLLCSVFFSGLLGVLFRE